MKREAMAGAATLILVLLAAGAGPAEARYRYSNYSGGSEEQGFYLFVEGALTNPRNTDGVVATTQTVEDFGGGINTTRPIVPTWDDEVAGRLGFGYSWANGNRLQGSIWSYSGDQTAAGNGPAGGLTHFAVGPPIPTMGGYVGNQGSPGYFNITNEIKASTVDLAWGRGHEMSDSFRMEWSVGVRYAKFEETSDGVYDEAASTDAAFGQLSYDAIKIGEGEMFGIRSAVRGSFQLSESFSVSSSLGVSFLDGELNATSALVPSGTANLATVGSSVATLTDDSRSGNIRDLDLVVTWQSGSDRVRVWFGWEQAIWDDIAADPLRNLPGATAPLKERDSVTFSGYKLGMQFRF